MSDPVDLVLKAAAEHAKTLELRGISIAIVDTGGVLLAFRRAPGMPGLTAVVAEAKACTSNFTGMPTAQLAKVQDRWPGLTNPISARLAERFTLYAGGQPVRDLAPIGGIGVSGGTPEQDDEIALHAIEAARAAASA
ncbi:GlcG/HbpS family heme-binding protein [Phenylobacterium immobile]|uniref:GlcG/HbpS family heme-binding protein n=1 Tax=Phenylobacterium immobile TaxID=21 RepID=UPI000A8E5017|nr:heme-binding protein [Phenylobacterium immobile]